MRIYSPTFYFLLQSLYPLTTVSLFILGGLTVTSVVGLVRAITLYQVKGYFSLDCNENRVTTVIATIQPQNGQ